MSSVSMVYARPGGARPRPFRVKKKKGRLAVCVFDEPRCIVCSAYTVTVPFGTATGTFATVGSSARARSETEGSKACDLAFLF